MTARHQRLSTLPWPPFAGRVKPHGVARPINWTLALADILASTRPDSTAAEFLQSVGHTLAPLRAAVSAEFMSHADCAALDERSVAVEVRGTNPPVALVIQFTDTASITPEARAFVACLAHVAGGIPDLDETTDDAHAELLRTCRDLAEQLGQARALLDFLSETSRTYLDDNGHRRD